MGKKLFFYYFITAVSFLLIFCFINCSDRVAENNLILSSTGDSDVSTSGNPALLFDKDVYHAIDESADIVLYNYEATADTVTITIKSSADIAGINLDLTKSGDMYIGALLFNTIDSVDGTTIEVIDDCAVIANFNSTTPTLSLTHSVKWYDSIYFGLYSTIDDYTSNFKFGTIGNNELYRGDFGQEGTITTNAELTSDETAGVKYKHIVMENAGLWQSFSNNENLNAYNNGALHFKIKSEYNFIIKMEWQDGYAQVELDDYIVLSDEWQDVLIPLSDFSGIDLSTIKTLYGFHYWNAGIADFCFYDVYLER